MFCAVNNFLSGIAQPQYEIFNLSTTKLVMPRLTLIDKTLRKLPIKTSKR
jgi:hypothetical protein